MKRLGYCYKVNGVSWHTSFLRQSLPVRYIRLILCFVQLFLTVVYCDDLQLGFV